MQIGELSERTGASRRSLRYYEQKGLLHSHRSDNGWREYDEAAVNRVRNVRELLKAGLTVEDIHRVASCLDMAMSEFMACSDADHAISMYEERLAAIEAKVAVLQHHQGELVRRIAMLRTNSEAEAGRPLQQARR